jgi:hypothetical protein
MNIAAVAYRSETSFKDYGSSTYTMFISEEMGTSFLYGLKTVYM